MRLPIEYIYQTFLFLGDSNILVQYYSAINLSEYLPKLDKDSSNQIISMCSNSIVDILRNYFTLAQEFNDYTFMELIAIYINFFGHELINYAIDFVMNTYQVFLKCVTSNNPVSSNIIISSISLFIQLLPPSSDISDQVSSLLLHQLLSDVTKVPLQSVESVIDLISSVISISSTISSAHWDIFTVLRPIQAQFPHSVCLAYSNLLIRDRETPQIPSVAATVIECAVDLLSATQSSDVLPVLSLFSTILVVLRGAPGTAPLFPHLLQLALDALNAPHAARTAADLFAALLICDPPHLLALLGRDRRPALALWAERAHFRALASALPSAAAALDSDELAALTARAAALLDAESQRRIIAASVPTPTAAPQLFAERDLVTAVLSLAERFDAAALETALGAPLSAVRARAAAAFALQ